MAVDPPVNSGLSKDNLPETEAVVFKFKTITLVSRSSLLDILFFSGKKSGVTTGAIVIYQEFQRIHPLQFL